MRVRHWGSQWEIPTGMKTAEIEVLHLIFMNEPTQALSFDKPTLSFPKLMSLTISLSSLKELSYLKLMDMPLLNKLTLETTLQLNDSVESIAEMYKNSHVTFPSLTSLSIQLGGTETLNVLSILNVAPHTSIVNIRNFQGHDIGSAPAATRPLSPHVTDLVFQSLHYSASHEHPLIYFTGVINLTLQGPFFTTLGALKWLFPAEHERNPVISSSQLILPLREWPVLKNLRKLTVLITRYEWGWNSANKKPPVPLGELSTLEEHLLALVQSRARSGFPLTAVCYRHGRHYKDII